MMLDRRRIVIGGAVVAVAGAGFMVADGMNLFYTLTTEETSGEVLSAQQAHALAVAGEITLIDIRRPDEWADTGIGESAQRLDMRRDDFVDALTILAQGELDAPLALICARGVRSARLSNQLMAAGFTNIIDVPEGMLGSAAGTGWLAKGLPVVKDN